MLKENKQELDGIKRPSKSFTVTVLGKLMGSETKRDVLSIVRKDVAFRKETSLRVGCDILDGVDAVSDMFDIDDASFVECLAVCHYRPEDDTVRTEQNYQFILDLSLGRVVASHNRERK